VNVSRLTLTENQIMGKLSPILNYCPVELKSTGTFHSQSIRSEHLVFFDN
jgi:hypothetical protein